MCNEAWPPPHPPRPGCPAARSQGAPSTAPPAPGAPGPGFPLRPGPGAHPRSPRRCPETSGERGERPGRAGAGRAGSSLPGRRDSGRGHAGGTPPGASGRRRSQTQRRWPSGGALRSHVGDLGRPVSGESAPAWPRRAQRLGRRAGRGLHGFSLPAESEPLPPGAPPRGPPCGRGQGRERRGGLRGRAACPAARRLRGRGCPRPGREGVHRPPRGPSRALGGRSPAHALHSLSGLGKKAAPGRWGKLEA